jgi:RHS repeat-associated protein
LTDFGNRTFNFSYDALGRRTGFTRPNGVNTSYAYDSLSRLLSVLHQTGPTIIDGTSYTYDSAGNRITKTSAAPGNLGYNFSYDPLYQLTQVVATATGKTTEKYTYDAVGDRLSSPGVPYTYDDDHKMLTREGATYTYDLNGSTLSKTNGSGTTSYSWDFENRLSGVVLPGTTGTVTFKYDPFGRRIYKNSPAGTTIYVYDSDNIIEELTGAGALSERYTYGPGIDEPLVGQRQPKIFYYEADGLGSITSLTDPTAAVAATYTYDSFGFLTGSTGIATNWLRYTARQFDSDTALYYYRARYYDPTTGHFLSEDPNRDGIAGSLYSYVDNSPLGYTDALGEDPQAPGLFIGPNVTPHHITQFNNSLADALNRLNNSDCRKIFCGKNSKGDPTTVLQNTSYRLESLKNSTGAQTNPDGSVFINLNGPFFQQNTTIFIPSDNPQRSGRVSVEFNSLADLGAFVLLHELGHEIGVFPADIFPFINGRHSLRVLDACFNKGVKVGN